MTELREYNTEFAKAFSLYRNNSAILNNGYDKVPNPYTLDDALQFFQIQMSKKPTERFLIFWNEELAGEIGIEIKSDVFRMVAEIGYFIAEPFWHKGIATKAISLMTDYAFSTFTIVRLEAGVFEFNTPSMKALEKNGYHLESVRKKAILKNGKIMDDFIYVRLREV